MTISRSRYDLIAKYQSSRRQVKARSTTRTAVLGDETQNIYSDRLGYYFARPIMGADENGNALLGPTFYLRANPAAGIMPRPGYKVFYKKNERGQDVIVGADLDDLDQKGVDSRVIEPNNPNREFLYLFNIVNLKSEGVKSGLKVNCYPWQYQTADNVVHHFIGTNAAGHVDLADNDFIAPSAITAGRTSIVPTVDNTRRWALLVFNVTKHLADEYPLEVYPGLAVTIAPDAPLTINEDLQTCYDVLPTDEIIIPIKAYYLEHGQTTIAGISEDVDVRQFINVPSLSSGGGITELTGDVTASGSGSQAATIAHNAITQAKMADNAVGTAEIIDANVTMPKLANNVLHIDTVDPYEENDVDEGYEIRSLWFNGATNLFFICTDNTAGAAIWQRISPGLGLSIVADSGSDTLIDGETLYVEGAGGITTSIDPMTNILAIDGSGIAPFVDTTAIVKGSGDATKRLRFEVDGFPTATTVVLTPPNYDGTIATLSGAETLANKVLSQLHLLIGGVKAIFTHAFTADRTVTIPGDANITLVGEATVQTLAGKTLTSPAIADYTNAQHDHSDIDDGGQLTGAAINVTAHHVVIGNGTSGLASLAPGTARNVMISDGTDWTARALALADVPNLIAILRDEKTSGTNGGTSAATTWNARDLNTELYDPGGIVSISSNQFTPIAGDYEILVFAPFRGGAAAQANGRLRLYNVTGAAAVEEGMSVSAVTNTFTVAVLHCTFTANGASAYRIDTYTSVGIATSGLGVATSDGSPEVYTSVYLRKVA